MLHHTDLIKEKLYEDMLNFDINKNIKCNFKVLVYLYNDNEDYNLLIPNEFQIWNILFLISILEINLFLKFLVIKKILNVC
jgi:hypothetical protein